MRYFSPDRDISSFKRYFHCIMRADLSARDFRRRNKPRHTQIAIIRRFCPNLCAISLPNEIFRRLNALLTALCVQIVVHDCSAASKQAHTQAYRNHSSILTKFMRNFSPIEIFRRLNAIFTALCVQNVVHAFPIVGTPPDTRKSQPLVDFDENYALFLSHLIYFCV